MTQKEIAALLKTNKNKLLKEVEKSKELVFLLKKSATQNLNDTEKERIKIQLIDIFKTIPALAIFLLPGGMLLLPLVVKIIPNILPENFGEDIKTNPKP